MVGSVKWRRGFLNLVTPPHYSATIDITLDAEAILGDQDDGAR